MHWISPCGKIRYGCVGSHAPLSRLHKEAGCTYFLIDLSDLVVGTFLERHDNKAGDAFREDECWRAGVGVANSCTILRYLVLFTLYANDEMGEWVELGMTDSVNCCVG